MVGLPALGSPEAWQQNAGMQLLYHYCSGMAFHAMLGSANPTVWQSAMTQSNDSMEGKLVRETLQRMAERDGLTPPQIAWMLAAADEVGESVDCLAFCMSSNGDLLSQWRGYADDGAGFSIGFRPAYWHFVASGEETIRRKYIIDVGKVLYEHAEHEEMLRAVYDYMKQHITSQRVDLLESLSPELVRRVANMSDAPQDDIHFGESLLDYLTETVTDSLARWFLLKSKAFAEEAETRLLTLVPHPLPEMCQFRMRGSEMIPYLPYGIDRARHPIARVVLGPKNPTPVRVVESFLRKAGFDGVTVDRSEASYR